MDNNEFFREATLRICGSLEIEKALFSVLNFLMQFMPVSIMLIEYYEDNLSATKTIAKATAQGGKSLDLLTPFLQKPWNGLHAIKQVIQSKCISTKILKQGH